MTMMVTVQEVRASLTKLLARVMDGEEILISQDGKPVARLVPAGELAQPDGGLDEKMARLELAAQARSESRFLAAQAAMDWTKRSARDYLRAARFALMAGAHLAARRIAQEGAQRYPDDGALPALADVLAPPKVTGRSPADPNWAPNMAANRVWLKAHAGQYASQYVALRNGSLVDATVFVPDLKPDQAWGDLPSFIGLSGCLERMRFAVDPATEMFYFGPLGEG